MAVADLTLFFPPLHPFLSPGSISLLFQIVTTPRDLYRPHTKLIYIYNYFYVIENFRRTYVLLFRVTLSGAEWTP